MDDTPQDDDAISRLFRENDDIGSDSSLWLRPLRQLLRDGKPLGDNVALTVIVGGGMCWPLGMFTETKKNRLVFWPVWPSGLDMTCDAGGPRTFDHTTFEFPSEKIHVTGYDERQEPVRGDRTYRARHYPDSNLAMWFELLIQTRVLRQQETAVQRRVRMPSADKDRRLNEVAQYSKALRFWDVQLPERETEYDYIYMRVYVAPEPITRADLPTSVVDFDPRALREVIDGLPDSGATLLNAASRTLRQRTICVVVGCPSGKLRDGVCVGFPEPC